MARSKPTKRVDIVVSPIVRDPSSSRAASPASRLVAPATLQPAPPAIPVAMQLTLVKRPVARRPGIHHQHRPLAKLKASKPLAPTTVARRRKPTKTYCTLEDATAWPFASPPLSSASGLASSSSSTPSPLDPNASLPPIPGRRTAAVVVPRAPVPLYWPFPVDAADHDLAVSATSKNKPAPARPSAATQPPAKDNKETPATAGRRTTGRATRRSGTQAAKRVQQQLEKEKEKLSADVSPKSDAAHDGTAKDAQGGRGEAGGLKRASPRKKRGPIAGIKRKRGAADPGDGKDDAEAGYAAGPPAKRPRASRAQASSARAEESATVPVEEPASQATAAEDAPVRTTRGSRSSTRAAAAKQSSASNSSSAGASDTAGSPPVSEKAASKSPTLKKGRRSRSNVTSPVTANATAATVPS